MAFTNEGTWYRVIRRGPMPTPVKTVGGTTWTLIFVLLILILAMVYLAY